MDGPVLPPGAFSEFAIIFWIAPKSPGAG